MKGTSGPLDPPRAPAPWGLGATTGLSFIIALGFIGAQMVVGMGIVLIPSLRGQAGSAQDLASNGLFWSLATCASTPVAIGLSWLFAFLRPGITVKEYLGLRNVPIKELFRWCVVLLALLVCFDLTTTFLNRPIVPNVMIEAYRTAQVMPLLWLALIVGAPLAEEIFFRGFLFKGLLHSRLGPVGAIVVTSTIWSGIHLQYDLYGMAIIFLTGIALGFSRWRTGSLYPAIAMHALMNLIATIQVAMLVRYGGDSPVP